MPLYAALGICESFATFIRDYRTFLGKKNIRRKSRLDLKVVQYSQRLGKMQAPAHFETGRRYEGFVLFNRVSLKIT